MTAVAEQTVPPVVEPELEDVEGRFYITGYLDQDKAEKLIQALYDWDTFYPNGPWTVVITSEGGEMSAGIAIYSELLSYAVRGGGTHWVTTLVRGVAASAASLILQAGDMRVGGVLDQLMIHEPNYTCEDMRLCDVKNAVARMDGYHEQFIDVCMKRCKLPRDEFVNRIQGDWWMVIEEAIEVGLVDHLG